MVSRFVQRISAIRPAIAGNWRSGLMNSALVLGSVAVTLAFLELVVFRFILVPDDLLVNVTQSGIVRYQPNTRATFRHPDGRSTRITINAHGWNSTHQTYAIKKTSGRMRVAVVGDSYVHGAFVDVDQGFPAILEQRLQRPGRDAEVFRFGMDGAPLSQYLHMLRGEVLRYQPDVVVVPLIHNDFDESYRLLKTRYASSFMKLKMEGPDGKIVEIPPTPFKPGLADRLRAWNTFRYVYYETGLYLQVRDWISPLFWGGTETWDPEFISSGVDVRKIRDHRRNALFARYVLEEMRKLSVAHGFRLIFVMDGVREAIYENRNPPDYEVGRLNTIAANLTGELRLEFHDLQSVFQQDYDVHGKRFEFAYDWHWNVRANELVANVLADAILTPAASGGLTPNALSTPLAQPIAARHARPSAARAIDTAATTRQATPSRTVNRPPL